jgi:proliferating cell nuclear antigen
MIIKIDKPKILSDAISIISEIVSEVRIKLNEDGMSIVAVDPANVAMVIFKFPKESFSQYQTGNETWGINLSDLKAIMKRASSSSSVVFEQEDNRLKISIFDKVKRIFNLALIDIESEDKNEPSLNFSCKVEMNSNIFTQAIEDCSIVADSCSFILGKEFFIVEGAGSLNSARAEFSGDEANFNGIGRSKYSLEYLMKFIKAGKISDKVVINFSSDYPLKLDFPGNEMGMGFVLAPRVEND